MISRRLQPALAASTRSVLLLGPRQTGKSTLMATLAPDLSLNLAHEPTYLEFARNPAELDERLAAVPAGKARFTVLLDKVQRLPSLLNTVQVLLDRPDNRLRFLLTGSSARRLRRGNANLLPGRIHTYHLGPLTSAECGYALDTREVLATGTLPGILSDPDGAGRRKTLRSYAATYLKEEIQAESLTRNLEGFARFLHVAGEWCGHHLDLSKIAAAAQVTRQSVARYMEILEDTLLVHRVEPFANKGARRLVQHPKFYFSTLGFATVCSAASKHRPIASARCSSIWFSRSSSPAARPWMRTVGSRATAPATARKSTSSSNVVATCGLSK